MRILTSPWTSNAIAALSLIGSLAAVWYARESVVAARESVSFDTDWSFPIVNRDGLFFPGVIHIINGSPNPVTLINISLRNTFGSDSYIHSDAVFEQVSDSSDDPRDITTILGGGYVSVHFTASRFVNNDQWSAALTEVLETNGITNPDEDAQLAFLSGRVFDVVKAYMNAGNVFTPTNQKRPAAGSLEISYTGSFGCDQKWVTEPVACVRAEVVTGSGQRYQSPPVVHGFHVTPFFTR